MEKSTNGEPFEMPVLSGHSRSFSLMLELLGRYSHAGAHMMAAGSLPVEEGASVEARASCPDCTVEYARVDRTDPDALRALDPGSTTA